MTLRVPKDIRAVWKVKRPDKLAMTYEHASATVKEGLARKTRRHRSVAIGVAAQFEFTLRQIDVIGEWEKVAACRHSSPEPSSAGARCGVLACASKTWRRGLST